FFNDTSTTKIYTLSLHDALPISLRNKYKDLGAKVGKAGKLALETDKKELALLLDKLKYLNRNPMLKHFFSEKNSKPKEELFKVLDRKSTRLNSSHVKISYAVFCL